MDSYPKKYKYDGFYINQHGHHFPSATLQHPSYCRYIERFPLFYNFIFSLEIAANSCYNIISKEDRTNDTNLYRCYPTGRRLVEKSAGLTAKSVLGKNCWLALKAGLKIFWNLIGRKQFVERRASLLRQLQSHYETASVDSTP